jgi:hypothetical protein
VIEEAILLARCWDRSSALVVLTAISRNLQHLNYPWLTNILVVFSGFGLVCWDGGATSQPVYTKPQLHSCGFDAAIRSVSNL